MNVCMYQLVSSQLRIYDGFKLKTIGRDENEILWLLSVSNHIWPKYCDMIVNQSQKRIATATT
jgi:hypothetical protein